jgi:hypothetical protein
MLVEKASVTRGRQRLRYWKEWRKLRGLQWALQARVSLQQLQGVLLFLEVLLNFGAPILEPILWERR